MPHHTTEITSLNSAHPMLTAVSKLPLTQPGKTIQMCSFFFTHNFQINARCILLANKGKAYLEIQNTAHLEIQQAYGTLSPKSVSSMYCTTRSSTSTDWRRQRHSGSSFPQTDPCPIAREFLQSSKEKFQAIVKHQERQKGIGTHTLGIHKRTVLSLEPEATRCPEGENWTHKTASLWPKKRKALI